MAKTKELKKRSWGNVENRFFVSFGSRLPCERLSFQRVGPYQILDLRPGTEGKQRGEVARAWETCEG